VLFRREAWERFFILRHARVVTLYLVNHLKYERADALSVYAMYTGSSTSHRSSAADLPNGVRRTQAIIMVAS